MLSVNDRVRATKDVHFCGRTILKGQEGKIVSIAVGYNKLYRVKLHDTWTQYSFHANEVEPIEEMANESS